MLNKIKWLYNHYLGYRDYARDDARTHRIHHPRLWAMREILWDYCPVCFHHYYSYLVWRKLAPPRSEL